MKSFYFWYTENGFMLLQIFWNFGLKAEIEVYSNWVVTSHCDSNLIPNEHYSWYSKEIVKYLKYWNTGISSHMRQGM